MFAKICVGSQCVADALLVKRGSPNNGSVICMCEVMVYQITLALNNCVQYAFTVLSLCKL